MDSLLTFRVPGETARYLSFAWICRQVAFGFWEGAPGSLPVFKYFLRPGEEQELLGEIEPQLMATDGRSSQLFRSRCLFVERRGVTEPEFPLLIEEVTSKGWLVDQCRLKADDVAELRSFLLKTSPLPVEGVLEPTPAFGL